MDKNIPLNGINKLMDGIGLSGVSEAETIFIILAAFTILFFILCFAFRRVVLWYFRVNVQVETLVSIDSRLKNFEEKLICKQEIQEENEEKIPAVPVQTDMCSCVEEMNKKDKKDHSGDICIGKSGKVYTEEELLIQIRE